MRKSLTRSQRLSRKSDVARLFDRLQTEHTSVAGLGLRWCGNGLGYSRVLFAPVRSLGKAVVRNRLKRWLRQDYQGLQQQLAFYCDMAILIYPLQSDSHSSRTVLLRQLFEQAGLLK